MGVEGGQLTLLSRTIAAVIAIVGFLWLVPVAQGATYRFPAGGDTYVSADNPTAANGDLPYLKVASTPDSRAYLRFDVRGLDGPVQGAYLELYALADAGPAGVAARRLSTDDWAERGITYLDAPPLGSEVDETGSFTARTRVYLDVTALVNGDGRVDVGLSTTGWTTRWFASRESPTPPRLIVLTPGSGDGPSGTQSPEPAISGEPMPTGDLPGWHQVFADDFSGTQIDTRNWGTYSGQPSGDPGAWWDPSHVAVAGGAALLQAYRDPAFGGRWVSGGMSSGPALKQTYGKYLVRFRMDAGYGVFPVLLLFPSANHWPPEIDFAEDGGASHVRDHINATLHYGTALNHFEIDRTAYADFTRWHTAGVEWTNKSVTYTLDGLPWATVTGDMVPAEPMELDIQTQTGTPGDTWNPAPDATTPPEVDMQVDWVVAYAPAGP